MRLESVEAGREAKRHSQFNSKEPNPSATVYLATTAMFEHVCASDPRPAFVNTGKSPKDVRMSDVCL